MKKFICALFLFVFVFFNFSGNIALAENVSYLEKNAYRIAKKIDEDGKISIYYCFPLNSDLMQDFSADELNVFKFYLTTYVNALAKTYRKKEVEGSSVGRCVYFSDVDALGFIVSFENTEAQKAFFSSSESEEKPSETKIKSSGFFIKRTEIYSDFVFSSKESAEGFRSVCLLAIDSWSDSLKISDERKQEVVKIFEGGVFVYDSASLSPALKSQTMYSDGKYSHNVFVKTVDEIEENPQIVYYVTSPNRAVWYGFALVCVLSGMVISYFVLKKKRKI